MQNWLTAEQMKPGTEPDEDVWKHIAFGMEAAGRQNVTNIITVL